jgi:hypothetical protein
MTAGDDDEVAVSYKVLARGTPIQTADGVDIGAVREVLENDREHIFDGIVIDTPGGRRFVDPHDRRGGRARTARARPRRRADVPG